jgi:hypothetical protein
MSFTQSISDGTGWSDKLDDATTLAMLERVRNFALLALREPA